MPSQLKSFEGPDVQVVLDRIRAELGPGVKISGAERIRVGGILGFFAKERFRVVVETPDDADNANGIPSAPALASAVPDAHLSRRQRRRLAAASPETPLPPAPVVETPPLPEPAVAAVPMAEESVDVFHSLAEATDDVNDVAGDADVMTTTSPVPSPTVVHPAPPGAPESFDAVLTRVATSLENPDVTGGPGHDVPTADSGPPEADQGPDYLIGPQVRAGDGFDALAGIASKAALYLAENAPPPPDMSGDDVPDQAPSPPEPDGVVATELRRLGFDDTMTARIADGLLLGRRLETLLLEAFSELGPAPSLPRRTGSLLVVVGAGTPTRRLAAAVAGEIGIDPSVVPFASLDADAYAVVTGKFLVRSAEDAAEHAPGWRRSQAAVVAVDAAVTGGERSWARHLIASLRPTAVWGVVEATSKTEDIAAWVESLGGVDALALENLACTVSPAAALRIGIPVVRIDGQPATPLRWVATIVDRLKS